MLKRTSAGAFRFSLLEHLSAILTTPNWHPWDMEMYPKIILPAIRWPDTTWFPLAPIAHHQ